MTICKHCNQKIKPTEEGFCPECNRQLEAPGRKKILVTSAIILISTLLNVVPIVMLIFMAPMMLDYVANEEIAALSITVFAYLLLAQVLVTMVCGLLGFKNKDNVAKSKPLVILSRIALVLAFSRIILFSGLGLGLFCSLIASLESLIILFFFHGGAQANYNVFIGKSSLKNNSHL